MNSVKSSFVFKITSLIIVFFIAACAVNPVTGKKQLVLMSEQQEIALGAESDPAVIQQFGLYQNDAIQSFINEHGQEMVKISHRPNLKFTFRIVDSPVVNAFALPGGYVYFTRGIMAHFNNEAEFAGVLGHEIGHVTARHSVEQYTKSTVAQVLLIGGIIISPELRAFANEAQTAMGLLFLKYSRDNESQADQLGVEYSTKVGYDAHEMADFFKTLKALSESQGEELPTFFSTHPDPSDRYNKVDKAATEWQAKDPNEKYKINRDAFLKMVDGIVYGEDPRQGFLEAGVFYHPELKFQFPVPNNWEFLNSPTQVQMAPSNGKALMIFSLSSGSSLQAAAQATGSELGLTVVDSRQITINGLQALEVLSTQTSQDPNTGAQSSIAVKSVYIQYKSEIYVFHGVTTPADFQGFESTFDRTMTGFKGLTDQSKLNRQPERINLVTVKQAGTISQALQANGIPSNRVKEFAIVNGMEEKAQVSSGTVIKVLAK